MAQPYWLIREPGKHHGVGTVDLDTAITAAKAVESYLDALDPEMRQLFELYNTKLEAALVTLHYEDGQPIVEEITL